MSAAREDLLARVVDYYARNGVRDTSLRTLAAAIGTSQRMLHYHFGSRGDVLAAVIEAIAGSQADQMAALFADDPDPLAAGHRNWVATAEGAARYGALWFELATHAMRREPYAAHLGEVMVAAQLRAFTAVYERYVDPSRARRLARVTVGVGQGLLFDLLVDGDREGADEAAAEFAVLVRTAIESDGGAQAASPAVELARPRAVGGATTSSPHR